MGKCGCTILFHNFPVPIVFSFKIKIKEAGVQIQHKMDLNSFIIGT